MSSNEDIRVVDSTEAQDVDYGSADIIWVLEFALEPSYVSEIARKMIEAGMPYNYNFGGADNNVLMDGDGDVVDSLGDVDRTWSELTENKAIRTVSSIVNTISEADEVVSISPDYEHKEGAPEGSGQAQGSPHLSFSGTGSVEEDLWRSYKVVVHRPDDDMGVGDRLDEFNVDGLGDKVRGLVDTSVNIPDKVRTTKRLSGWGNDMSRIAEEIMQDSFDRQFQYYDEVDWSGYNAPGLDFYVEDENRRDWGLAIEISVRWVNPIDKPYVEEKKDRAFERDADLVILAPRFTKRMVDKYEPVGDERYHEDPLEKHVHLHSVPSKTEEVYRPFAMEPEDLTHEMEENRGNPIIISDPGPITDKLDSVGLVGDGYPIVDSDHGEFRRLLDGVIRDFDVITESRFRNSIREAIEPLLWEFSRPWKIEQFLIDTYWDHGKQSQEDVADLVDTTPGTIGKWMKDDWDVMRRYGGAPELSDKVLEVWKLMYLGEEPFDEVGPFSGYRIQAEYNRHPLWGVDEWREWFKDTDAEDRKEVMSAQGEYRDNLDYTLMVGATDRLLPSYDFIIGKLKDAGVEIREGPDAVMAPYQAYPSDNALDYMINKDNDTVVEVE